MPEFETKYIVFKAVQDPQTGKFGPSPVMIKDTEDQAIGFIQAAQARGQRGGWSYAPCPEQVKQIDRAIAGYIPGYRVSKVNDPNRGG